MKRTITIVVTMLLVALTTQAKKVTLTIDGTTRRTQTELYLIINEDIDNAQKLTINDQHFSVTITVDRNDFIRLHDYKGFPERSQYVLIPDSKHITINMENGSIEGSPLSQRLQGEQNSIRRESPEHFHIDVFSDDPEAHLQARIQEREMRSRMEETQKMVIRDVISRNQKNIIPAWLVYCYHNLFTLGAEEMINGSKAKWTKHPILDKIIRVSQTRLAQ